MKSIISIITICATAATLTDASAQLISSTDDLSNTAAYTLNRRSSSNAGYVASGSTSTVQVGAQATADQSLWSIHYSNAEKAYYLYNLTAGKFVGEEGGKATLTDAPIDVVPLYVDHIAGWLIDCGGSLLGINTDLKDGTIYLENYTAVSARTTGAFFQISKSANRTLTQAESDAIEAKIKAQRPALLTKYSEFIDKAKKMAEDGLTNYAGAYDVTELEKALAEQEKYAMSEIEAIYRATLDSKRPQTNHYYVLRDVNRPSSFKNNSLSITGSGTLSSRQQTTPKIGSGTSSYPEALNLFTVEYPSANVEEVQIRCAATGQYLVSNGANNSAITLGDKSSATTFTMEARGEFNRQFRFKLPDSNGWVTVSGENKLVNYSVAEEPNFFYFERIKFLTVTLNAYGTALLTLPCPVTIDDKFEAIIAVEESEGKVYLENHKGIIPANTPFVIKSTEGAKTALLTLADENPEFNNDNILVGTNVFTKAPNPHHALKSTADGLSFMRNESTASISPNSAYLISSAGTDLTTTFDKRPNTHITEVESDAINGEDTWYDLQGRRVNTPTPGNLYINGTTRQLILVK